MPRRRPASTPTTSTICLLWFAPFVVAAVNPANSTEPLVCTPTECLQGHNSLTAGIVVDVPFNSTTEQISLLPGTYTPSTFASPSNSTLTPFSNRSTARASRGFNSTGQLTSGSSSPSFEVELLPGLTAYSAPLYEGTATYVPLPNSTSNSTLASTVATTTSSISSLLLTSPYYAILSTASTPRLVVWDSVPDVGALGTSSSSNHDWQFVRLESSSCATPCSTGGHCSQNGTCVCEEGWTGSSCASCAPGRFGRDCQPCPVGCTECDDGVSGSGLCLDAVRLYNVTVPSDCNCINGICSSNSTTATCACNAGWTKASNGTQCAACAEGYYLSSGGDCLACDASCATCSSPSGTCLTCQAGLQPLSSSSTACTTATTALSNGTFFTCPSRTYFSQSADSCVACNSMCEACFDAGSDACLECRAPNVLLGGVCVAFDSKTGVCDSSENVNATKEATGKSAGWVYDNEKKVCDALPARCTAGGIDSFTSGSPRSALSCSACIPGSFLVDGKCVDLCPEGTTVSSDGLTCQACDSSCATCAASLPSFCTTCSTTSHLILNGTCISSSSCPTGTYATPSSPVTNSTTCVSCPAECETCSAPSSTSDGTSTATCLSCPADRPVLSNGRCLSTCSRSEYFDSSKGACVSCSDDCATCAGGGSDECLSCSGDRLRLRGGRCVSTDGGCSVIHAFGVCLKDLVTVEAKSETASDASTTRVKVPWWAILLIVAIVVALIVAGVWWFRKKEQKRKREHTAKFARELGNKEVDKKLAALPEYIAYPPLPRSYSSSPPTPLSLARSNRSMTTNNAKLRGSPSSAPQEVSANPNSRFVLEDPNSPISPSPSSSFGSASHRTPHQHDRLDPMPPGYRATPTPNRWSASSYGSKARVAFPPPLVRPGALRPEDTGGSFYSQKTFTTAAGNTLVVNSKNPFFSHREDAAR
ncbi:hypothetical protein JCM10212_001423 [Sporobolomyces blumeae]